MQLAVQGDSNVKFDPVKFTWLGSLSDYSTDRYLVVINSNHPAKTPEDLRKPGVRLRLGGDQPGSTNLTFAMVAKLVLDLNIDIVRGYPGAAPMFIAMQSGELDGQVIGYNSVRAGQPHLWNEKLVRPLIQFGRDTRLEALADVSTGQELVSDPDKKSLVRFAELPFRAALPFVEMVKDKAFLADAEKVNLEISAIDGDAVRDVIAQMQATPKAVIDRYNEIDATVRK